MGTLEVNVLAVGGNDICRNIAGDVKDSLIVLDCVLVVNGSIGILVFLAIVALLEVNDALHERVIQVEPNLRMVSIIICHIVIAYLLFCL